MYLIFTEQTHFPLLHRQFFNVTYTEFASYKCIKGLLSMTFIIYMFL